MEDFDYVDASKVFIFKYCRLSLSETYFSKGNEDRMNTTALLNFCVLM